MNMEAKQVAHTPGPRPVPKGHKRQWLRCRTCGNVAYYDYVPYSLSNPLFSTPCGHGIGSRYLGCDEIDEKTARAALTKAGDV